MPTTPPPARPGGPRPVAGHPRPGPVSPAAVAGCPELGGAAIPPATASGDVVFRGGGWGHGLGMSQYGAQGAALLGCTYDQILSRYYAGTEVGTRPMTDSVRLRMLEGGYRVDVRAVDGALTWVLPECVPLSRLSGPTPDAPRCPPVQPKGASWQLTPVDPLDVAVRALGPRGHPEGRRLAGRHRPSSRCDCSSPASRRPASRPGAARSIYLERWLRWDWTPLLDARRQAPRRGAVHRARAPSGPQMDKYLWGIAEVPASFPAEALKAQAVAARTYAAKRTGRVLMPTPADQNYTGSEEGDRGHRRGLGRRSGRQPSTRPAGRWSPSPAAAR